MNIIINVYETYQKVVNNYKDYTFEVNKNKIEYIKNFYNNRLKDYTTNIRKVFNYGFTEE